MGLHIILQMYCQRSFMAEAICRRWLVLCLMPITGTGLGLPPPWSVGCRPSIKLGCDQFPEACEPWHCRSNADRIWPYMVGHESSLTAGNKYLCRYDLTPLHTSPQCLPPSAYCHNCTCACCLHVSLWHAPTSLAMTFTANFTSQTAKQSLVLHKCETVVFSRNVEEEALKASGDMGETR